MNSTGKVLTIFLVIIAILLISLTAISLFFFQKETERRKLAEATLEEYRTEKVKLEDDLKEIKKQNFLLQEKNKEADDRINDLSDELELEKGLREEMKIETVKLQGQIDEALASKDKLTEEIKAKEKMQEELSTSLETSEQKIKELEAQLKAETERAQKLGEMYEQKQQEMTELEKSSQAVQSAPGTEDISKSAVNDDMDLMTDEDESARALNLGVELGEIVVVPGETMDSQETNDVQPGEFMQEKPITLDRRQGRVLSVDADTEFVIVSLGKLDGIEIGDVLSVYRGDDYVGDLRITRLQPEMSAADLIPPFSIRNVKKNDQVKVK